MAKSKLHTRECTAHFDCARCRADQAFLQETCSPVSVPNGPRIALVDLFCGCGGMTLGLVEAARRAKCRVVVPLAADTDEAAASIYQANFSNADVVTDDIATIFPGAIGTPLRATERKLATKLAEIDILVGGPPCQGHSDLNNHTRRKDPKNALYLRMARAAEVLRPKVVVIENVATVELDKKGVVPATKDALVKAGYVVSGEVLDLRRLGVPQRRRRYVMVASRMPTIVPGELLKNLKTLMVDHIDRTVHWAIGDLSENSYNDVHNTSGELSPENKKRIRVLFEKNIYDLPNEYRPKCHRDGNHSYVSMYGRLRWDRPAQTITTGFGSMGQGRYVHPQQRRTITPHEAARLQTFPDWFDFGIDTKRGVRANVIGNAVPPLLMVELGLAVLPALTASKVRSPKRISHGR